ncbi:hypothetical protein Pelo_13119 [Pelomyxa schiedti]|nr:hypothetical protein Pelo_13119 [Pelomyxa schiedti]
MPRGKQQRRGDSGPTCGVQTNNKISDTCLVSRSPAVKKYRRPVIYNVAADGSLFAAIYEPSPLSCTNGSSTTTTTTTSNNVNNSIVGIPVTRRVYHTDDSVVSCAALMASFSPSVSTNATALSPSNLCYATNNYETQASSLQMLVQSLASDLECHKRTHDGLAANLVRHQETYGCCPALGVLLRACDDYIVFSRKMEETVAKVTSMMQSQAAASCSSAGPALEGEARYITERSNQMCGTAPPKTPEELWNCLEMRGIRELPLGEIKHNTTVSRHSRRKQTCSLDHLKVIQLPEEIFNQGAPGQVWVLESTLFGRTSVKFDPPENAPNAKKAKSTKTQQQPIPPLATSSSVSYAVPPSPRPCAPPLQVYQMAQTQSTIISGPNTPQIPLLTPLPSPRQSPRLSSTPSLPSPLPIPLHLSVPQTPQDTNQDDCFQAQCNFEALCSLYLGPTSSIEIPPESVGCLFAGSILPSPTLTDPHF